MNQNPHHRSRGKRIVLCLLAAMLLAMPPLGAVSAAAQTPAEEELAVDPSGAGDGYSAVMYNNSSGLPTSEANTVLQSSDGFIWIGCYSGLVRYDGSNFERIDSTGGISSVVSLYEDSRQRLWVGTNDSGAAVMENGEFVLYNKDDGLQSLSVRAIAEDAEGNVFLGTTHGLVYVDPDGEVHQLDDARINEEYIRSVLVGSDDTLFGVTMSGAVFTICGQQVASFYDAAALGIADTHAILPDPAHPDCLYIGNNGSELYYGKLSDGGFEILQTYDIAPLEYINSLEAFGNMIWICTDSGIGYIKDDEFIPVENTPLNTSAENMMVDYQGNLWFASSKQGVMKVVPNQFTDIFQKYHLESEVVEATCLNRNQLFIGTKNSGLIVLSGGRILTEMPLLSSIGASGQVYSDNDLLKMLSGRRVRSITRDSAGRIWIATYSNLGLLCYDKGQVIRYTTEDGMPSERIRSVVERDDGALMVCCTGGLVIIQDGRITDIYNEKDGISNTEILTASQTGSGDMLIGTDGGGMYRIGADGLTHLGTESGLSSDVVMRIKQDVSRDLSWIVTSNSIGFMEADGTITAIQKFPYSNNFDLYESENGEMWILSSNGIYVADVEQLLANEEITPIFYGTDNGLPCITTSNSFSELSDEGDLFIAGTTGCAKVNINTPLENVADVMLSVPYIEADGVMQFPDASGQFVIPSSVKKLTIYSYVFNYSLVNPEVTYQLDGFEQTATTVKRSELTPAAYTNLRGGEYEFVIRIEDPQGQSSKELRIPIVKERALYEKWWVSLLGILAALGLIAICVKLYIDYRTRRYQEREREQKQFITEMVEAFAKVIDMKDSYTNGHSTRVAEYTVMLSRELGLDEETIDRYYRIALLHDIGKIGIPPEVLNKPGKLTDTEFNIIKSHSALGYQALKDISIMPELAIGAGAHHERPDGKGYPKGLKGDEIPRVAQIIAVADTFDAMYSDRPYRKRMNFDKAVSIMKEVRGTQLTEDVVDAFLRLVEKGEFRHPDDHGGGTTEDIDNIHRKQKEAEAQKQDPPQESKPQESDK